jgi:hypothetical protein
MKAGIANLEKPPVSEWLRSEGWISWVYTTASPRAWKHEAYA